MILETIDRANDIKSVAPEDYPRLAGEIREFLVEKISVSGGHLASNLGVVELTMALHLSFDLPKDKIIWDVGHQSYTHKLLTGRREGFDEIRSFGGISGFPNHRESSCDAFGTGHSSTAVSAGLGLAAALGLTGGDGYVVSVLGDGSLTGGMSYEALNNAAQLKKNFIIVLNDNNMSISKNIGGVSRMMNNIRTAPRYNELKEAVSGTLSRVPVIGDRAVRRIRQTKSSLKQLVIPGMFFENMGITYLGPVNGHDIPEMLDAFADAKRLNRPVVVHVMTQKGHGYAPAELDPEGFHGVGAFDVKTGKKLSAGAGPDYTSYVSNTLCRLAGSDPKIVAVTAAMASGVGLSRFRRRFPDRFFDVGIAEEHAVTFAAGLAAGGLKPYVCIYSSFLQRSYDQMIHDVCLQQLPVRFLIDRAGIVGNDGETHQGIFDLSYLSTIPGMTVLAPKNAADLVKALQYSVSFDGPIAIRYPRGEAWRGLPECRAPYEYGKSEILHRGSGVALIAAGSMVKTADEVCRNLREKGLDPTFVSARFIRPLDTELLRELSSGHGLIVTLEENVKSGGYGEHAAAFAEEEGLAARFLVIALPDGYVEHGNPSVLKQYLKMDAASITERILKEL